MDERNRTIAMEALDGWTETNKNIYLGLAESLFSQGYDAVASSAEIPSKRHGFVYAKPDPEASFTWVMFFNRDEAKSTTIWQFGPHVRGSPG